MAAEGGLIQYICGIADERKILVTYRRTGAGVLLCCASALIGGFVLGPASVVIGIGVGTAETLAIRKTLKRVMF